MANSRLWSNIHNVLLTERTLFLFLKKYYLRQILQKPEGIRLTILQGGIQ